MIVGTILLCFSFTMKQYTDEAAYQSAYKNIDRTKLGREQSFREFYSLKDKFSTNKHRIQDYGITLFLLGWILYGITRNNWKDIRGPNSKSKLLAIGYGAAVLTVFGYIGDLFLEFWRGSYPHWADSLGIPLSGVPLLSVAVAIIVTPFMLGVIGKFQTNQKIPTYGFKNYQWLYIGASAVTFLLLIICAVGGFFWLIPPIMMWLYFCLSILSGRNAANKSLQTDNLRGVCFVVSLSLHFTTKQTPHKLRLMAALERQV